MSKFSALEALLLEGSLTEQDLEEKNVTPSDFRKMREGTQAWMNGPTGGPKPVKKRAFRYCFVQERPTGWAKDVPMAAGWDLREFRERRSPIVFAHDYEGFPVARGGTVLRNKEYEGYASMIGNVEFPDEGKFDHVDLVHDMVAEGLLNCGSVGFDILKMRAPTEDEEKKYKLGKYSAMFEKCSLTEFSLCSVGRQPGAGVIWSEDGLSDFEKLLAGKEYSAEAVQEVRETIIQTPSTKSYHTLDAVLEMNGFFSEDRTDIGITVEQMSAAVDTLGGDVAKYRESLKELSERVSALEEKESAELSAEEEQSDEIDFDLLLSTSAE